MIYRKKRRIEERCMEIRLQVSFKHRIDTAVMENNIGTQNFEIFGASKERERETVRDTERDIERLR